MNDDHDMVADHDLGDGGPPMNLDHQLQEILDDINDDPNHPLWARLMDADNHVTPDTRIRIIHALQHFVVEGEDADPRVMLYLAMMWGFAVGTEFAKRGYEVTA